MAEAIKEVELAERLGVSRDVVRKVRQGLEEGRHWSQEHRYVELTPAGVQAVRAALSEPKETPPPLAGAVASGTEELKVVRIYPRNPRVLEAARGNGDVVRVRVRSNVNFVAGMAIPARELDPGLWALARACPRFRGRW